LMRTHTGIQRSIDMRSPGIQVFTAETGKLCPAIKSG
jgi:hypothetical protein